METESWPSKDTWSLHGNREIVSRYQILEKIGEGAFADVYRARRREDNHIVALKEVHDSDSSYREVKALLLLDHPNVVKLYEYFVQGSNVVLVLEYLASNLSQVIKAGNLSEADVKGWSIQILRGLSACHAASILHRDIKPANLLISEDGTLKIADFGTARVLGKDAEVDEYGYASEIADEDEAGSSLNDLQPYENRDEFSSHTLVSPQEAVHEVTLTGLNHELSHTLNAEGQADQVALQTGKLKVPDDRSYPSRESRYDDPEATSESPGHVVSDRDSDLHNRDGPFTASVPIGDGRRYLGVEKMVRSELVGRSVSGSHSTKTQVQDPGCCGWFSLDKDVVVLKDAEALVESQPTVKEHGYFNEEIDAGYRDKDATSDESDSSWKDKHGFQDLYVTQEMGKPAHDATVPHVKSEGDLLNKFQRFLKKRTGRLSSEEKVEASEIPLPEQDGGLMGEETMWKEPLKNWPHSSTLLWESSLTSVFSGSSAEVQRNLSAEIDTEQEEEPVQARAVGGQYGSSLASDTDIRKDDIIKNDLRGTCKDVRLDKSVDAMGMLRRKSPKYMSNGPLMEMAYARCPDGSSGAIGYVGDHLVMYSASKTHTRTSVDSGDKILEESKRGCVDGLETSSKEETLSGSAGRLKDDIESGETGTSVHSTISRSGAISIHGRGRTDCSRGNRSGQETGYGSAGSEKIVGTSWEHTGEHAGSMSDAEGTRWFGAPYFQDSYMEARNGDANIGVPVSGETGLGDSEFEEWEDVVEGGAYRRRGRSSQGTSDRFDNRWENGSEFTTMVGTRWYRAPELLYGATKYGMEMDIWSFGCIFGELLSGKPIFPGINDIDQLSRLVRILGTPTEREWEGVTLLPDFSKIRFVDDRSPVTLRNHLPNISENSLQFLQKVLAYDPRRRPTSTEGIEDEYFHKEPIPTSPCDLSHKIPEEQKGFCTDDEDWGKCPDSGDTDSANEWTYALQNQWQCSYATDSDHPLSD